MSRRAVGGSETRSSNGRGGGADITVPLPGGGGGGGGGDISSRSNHGRHADAPSAAAANGGGGGSGGGGGGGAKREIGSPRNADDTVGALLADVANALGDALRALIFADKRGWGPDEYEQVRALEDALDDAKRDFQELSPLVGGQFYYENDRRPESIEELRLLRAKFDFHAQNFRDWLRAGGPINPVWARETAGLKRELHRAQCRAARRIFAAEQEANARCLGAFEVYRRQRELDGEAGRRRRRPRGEQAWGELPRWNDGGGPARQQKGRDGAKLPRHYSQEDLTGGDGDGDGDGAGRRASLEALVPACNAVGRFERFGDRDVAFSCDFCDGFIVWEDVRDMPSQRAGADPADGDNEQEEQEQQEQEQQHPRWQAAARSASTGEAKTVVFAPVAVANHVAPAPGRWQAGILCPYCDEYASYAQGDGELEAVRYAQDEAGFASLASLQAHLEWHHAPVVAVPLPSLPGLLPRGGGRGSCSVM